MAFNDTLFQLGMDLTRSSPAHEEDIVAGSARVESGDRNYFFAERKSVHFAGSHLIVELIGAQRLDDDKHVELALKACKKALSASLIDVRLTRVPSKGAVASACFDVFMSGQADTYRCVDALRAAFGAREAVLKAHKRDAALPAHVLEVARKIPVARKAKAAARIRKAA